MKSTVNLNTGTILQIIGPVMDISFPAGKMPSIYNSLIIEGKTESGEKLKVVCEVQQLLGDNCDLLYIVCFLIILFLVYYF
jgi:F-type H+/Na+-transporting ATPase subunit beta